MYLTGRSSGDAELPVYQLILSSEVVSFFLGNFILFLCSVYLYDSFGFYLGLASNFLLFLFTFFHLYFTAGTRDLSYSVEGINFVFEDVTYFVADYEMSTAIFLLFDRLEDYYDEDLIKDTFEGLEIHFTKEKPTIRSKNRCIVDPQNDLIKIQGQYATNFETLGKSMYYYFIDKNPDKFDSSIDKEEVLRRRNLHIPPKHKPYLSIYGHLS